VNPYCTTCGVKYGKQLWKTECCCDGKVAISYLGPDPLVPRQIKQEPLKQEEMKETGPKISKKERLRLEKALGRPLLNQ
jgi:hypothetical protein